MIFANKKTIDEQLKTISIYKESLILGGIESLRLSDEDITTIKNIVGELNKFCKNNQSISTTKDEHSVEMVEKNPKTKNYPNFIWREIKKVIMLRAHGNN